MLLGAATGFSIFLLSISCMDGILFRKDEFNNLRFTPINIYEFLKAPFAIDSEKYKTVWALVPGISLINKLKLMSMNWVVLTGTGAMLEYCIRLYQSNSIYLFLK